MQTSPPSRADSIDPEPLDVIVQTDQRIVFQQTSGKRVTFNDDHENVVRKTTWCQTVWDVTDKEIQTDTNELEDDGSLNRTFEASYLDSGLGLEMSIDGKDFPHLLEDYIDEPLAFVHTSSLMSRKSYVNSRNERKRDIAVQTSLFRDFIQGSANGHKLDTIIKPLSYSRYKFKQPTRNQV